MTNQRRTRSVIRTVTLSRARAGTFLALLTAASGIVACSSGDGGGGSAQDGPGEPADAGSQERGADGFGIPSECRGFPLEGIRFSPGGETLPNTCEPFHPTLNNPYAVRCVDALPHFETPYLGDEYCILPPPPDLGMQVGVHPQGQASYWEQIWAGDLSGYLDGALTAEFELAGGRETEQTFDVTTPNQEAHHYYRVNSRMRTGSHHMASFFTPSALEEGWTDQVFVGGIDPTVGETPEGFARGTFFNVQRSDMDRPQGTVEIPEEDRGIGMPVGPQQGIHFDLHHFNTGTEPILREAWINVWWTTDVTQKGSEFAGVAPVHVPPGETRDLTATLTATGETRVLSLFGHRHAWTSSFTIWVERTDGTVERVYESYDWLEVPTYSYNSVTLNPSPDPDRQSDGGFSGVLTLRPGDQMHFTCHVEATAQRAEQLGVPMPTEPLTFGNEAFGAEMCVLYGYLTGDALEGAYMMN
jgi:hypothetical protein